MSDFRAINKLLPPASHMALIEEGYARFQSIWLLVGFGGNLCVSAISAVENFPSLGMEKEEILPVPDFFLWVLEGTAELNKFSVAPGSQSVFKGNI